MMIPEVRAETVAGYCRIDTPMDDADRQVLENIIMPAAKAHMVMYTGQTPEELDRHAELTVVYLALCSFLYDNRSLGSVTDQKQNELVASFLDGYNLNLMAWEV